MHSPGRESSDGPGVVSHAGSSLLRDLADAIGLTAALTDAPRHLRPRGAGHRPGRIAADLAFGQQEVGIVRLVVAQWRSLMPTARCQAEHQFGRSRNRIRAFLCLSVRAGPRGQPWCLCGRATDLGA